MSRYFSILFLIFTITFVNGDEMVSSYSLWETIITLKTIQTIENEKKIYFRVFIEDIEKYEAFKDDIIPREDYKQSTKTVLNRVGNYWRDATTNDHYRVDVFPGSEHPKGFEQPCCFNFSKTIKKQKREIHEKQTPEQKQRKKNIITYKNYNLYISNITPAHENKYSHIHPKLKKLFK